MVLGCNPVLKLQTSSIGDKRLTENQIAECRPPIDNPLCIKVL
jgi:hypothetical protein